MIVLYPYLICRAFDIILITYHNDKKTTKRSNESFLIVCVSLTYDTSLKCDMKKVTLLVRTL